MLITYEFPNTKTFLLKDTSKLVLWKIQFHGHVSNDLKDEEFIGTFYEKKTPQKTNQKVFRIEKVIKKKCDKLYAKWKHHDNLFNGWIDKKDLI